jgi:hypothetical protein
MRNEKREYKIYVGEKVFSYYYLVYGVIFLHRSVPIRGGAGQRERFCQASKFRHHGQQTQLKARLT